MMKPDAEQAGVFAPGRYAGRLDEAGEKQRVGERTPTTVRLIDPQGREAIKWPRGAFNFGNLVLYGSIVIAVLMIIFTFWD